MHTRQTISFLSLSSSRSLNRSFARLTLACSAIKICRLAFLLKMKMKKKSIFYVYRKNLVKSMSCVCVICETFNCGNEAGFFLIFVSGILNFHSMPLKLIICLLLLLFLKFLFPFQIAAIFFSLSNSSYTFLTLAINVSSSIIKENFNFSLSSTSSSVLLSSSIVLMTNL